MDTRPSLLKNSRINLRTMPSQQGNDEKGGDFAVVKSVPLTHLKSEHFPPEEARSSGILGTERNQKKTAQRAHG